MPYPENHPYRAPLAEIHNRITNLIFENEVTGETEIDYAGALAFLLGNVDLLAFAIEDLMDQVDFDPARIVPRSVDEV